MTRRDMCLVAVAGVLWVGGGPLGVVPAVAQSPEAEAVAILRGLETTRTNFKPFRVRGTVTRPLAPARLWNASFVLECEADKYRISTGKRGPVAVFDGEQLFCYDGGASATIIAPDRRATSCLAFDPRSLGLSTGLYSDLTLKENIAYHSGKDLSLTRAAANADGSEIVTVELTDQFGQRIRFDVEPRGPFRVHRYSKSVPRTDGEGIFTRYVTKSEYWPDDATSWLPRKVVMYDLPEGKLAELIDITVVTLEKPELVERFDPEIWTAKGLSLPFGQPVADLRIKRRIGYWNGSELVESLPPFQPQPIVP